MNKKLKIVRKKHRKNIKRLKAKQRAMLEAKKDSQSNALQ